MKSGETVKSVEDTQPTGKQHRKDGHSVRPSKRSGGLSELEGCVLAYVDDLEPCTAYAVRRELSRSSSSYWSGSAGSVYPLFKRLEKHGLIAGREGARGKRRNVLYRLTASGRQALLEWLQPGCPSALGGNTYDPFRTRMHFLQALSAPARRTFLRDAVAVTQEALRRFKHVAASSLSSDFSFETATFLGAKYELEARLRWLRAVERHLNDPVPLERAGKDQTGLDGAPSDGI